MAHTCPMNVRVAAQTLSRSTSDGLKHCRGDLKLPQLKDIEGMAKFAHVVDTAFDILNSRELYTSNPSKGGPM